MGFTVHPMDVIHARGICRQPGSRAVPRPGWCWEQRGGRDPQSGGRAPAPWGRGGFSLPLPCSGCREEGGKASIPQSSRTQAGSPGDLAAPSSPPGSSPSSPFFSGESVAVEGRAGSCCLFAAPLLPPQDPRRAGSRQVGAVPSRQRWMFAAEPGQTCCSQEAQAWRGGGQEMGFSPPALSR